MQCSARKQAHSKHGFCHGSGAAGLRRHHACKSSQTAFAHHQSFGLLAGWADQPQPRRLAPSLLFLSAPAALPLRTCAILNYTLGVGQIRLREVGFTAIRFCHQKFGFTLFLANFLAVFFCLFTLIYFFKYITFFFSNTFYYLRLISSFYVLYLHSSDLCLNHISS